MTKTISVTALSLLFCYPAAAQYGTAGCGLGSLVFEGDQTPYKQVIASTLNTTGMQPVSITFGISNCDAPAPLQTVFTEAYVEANKVALANDIARGIGETIVGLSKVYGCNNYIDFGRALKNEYENIFPDPEVSPREITQNIGQVAASSCDTRI
jgi:hypothetical protein